MAPEHTDVLLRDIEAAVILGISLPTFWRRVKDATIKPPIRIGRSSRWPKSEILDVIESAKAMRAA